MSIQQLQNFYKSSVSQIWETGTGIRYVTTKPTVSEGWLVVSPSNETIREIIYYTSTGTDSTGDYVVVSQRGVGGTTDQTHEIGEPIRMNITAEHIEAISDALDDIVAGGAQDASTVTKGITKLSVAPVDPDEPIAVGDNDTRLPTNAFTTYQTVIRTYNLADSPATWTKVSGLKFIDVELWGAGGGGASNSTGGGGGGGSYAKARIFPDKLGATETITISDGGAGGTGGGSGTAGGNSTFGSLITAYGGGGGKTGYDGGGGGGLYSAGDSSGAGVGGSPNGGSAGDGNFSIFGGGGGGTENAHTGGRSYYGGGGGGGVGGNSFYGGAGGGGHDKSGGTSILGGNGGSEGSAGSVPGGGGGGRSTSGSGGKGGAGRVIVTEFYI